MIVTAGHTDELIVVGAVFGVVVLLGWVAARWRRRPDDYLLAKWGLEDWGLGGRAFGSAITFFLMGGDLYTAYTFIAIPALVYGTGAGGFYAVAFAVMGYPLIYLTAPRLWSVAHRHGFVTAAEFVRARFDSRTLATLVAITSIVATLPYIALQLIGLRVVFQAMGLSGDLPVTLAFAILAFFTFNSGLRAPALIAILKDILLALVILSLVLWFLVTQGGWGHVFTMAQAAFAHEPRGTGGLLLSRNAQFSYVSLALGSALAIFLYPHGLTGVLAARNRATIKRNLCLLPIYTVMLGFFALLGFAALSDGVRPAGGDLTTIMPQLLQSSLNGWVVGLAFAALSVGALVPASIMAIGAANLFTRGIYKEFLAPGASPAAEIRVSRIASLLVKLGALCVALFLTTQFSVDLQLTGGVIILQILPAAALGLLTNWFHRRALTLGMLAGLAAGLVMLYQIPSVGVGGTVISQHFGGDSWPLSHLDPHTTITIYAGLLALAVNLAVTVVGTFGCRALGVPAGVDATQPEDYTADEDDSEVRRMEELVDGLEAAYDARHSR